MIVVTKLNDQQLYINSDYIECIEAIPDTTITMTTGRKIIAKEPIDDVIDKIIDYKRKIYR